MLSMLHWWYPTSPNTRSAASRIRCCVRWPRTPTLGLSEKGARRRTALGALSTSGVAGRLLVSAHLVLHRVHDRRSALPVRDAVLLQRHRVLVLVQPGPVRVVELVQREARVER